MILELKDSWMSLIGTLKPLQTKERKVHLIDFHVKTKFGKVCLDKHFGKNIHNNPK